MADPTAPIHRIPLVLLTGCLGSGKTTLLRALLRAPEAANSAVLVNELGAVGLDHHLLWGAADTTLVLENGCVCCSAQEDLAGALEALFWQRLQRKLPRFDRVVIETTGIAHPAGILDMLDSRALVAERYALALVLCTVDAVFGLQQAREQPEFLAQVCAADALVLTKTDIADPVDLAALERLLRQRNPAALLRRSAGQAPVDGWVGLFEAGGRSSRGPLVHPTQPQSGALAHRSITSFAVRFGAAASRASLEATLARILQRHGARILRVKGVVNVAGDTRAWVVQAVRGRLSVLEPLGVGAPAQDAGFLVFITAGLPREDVLDGQAF